MSFNSLLLVKWQGHNNISFVFKVSSQCRTLHFSLNWTYKLCCGLSLFLIILKCKAWFLSLLLIISLASIRCQFIRTDILLALNCNFISKCLEVLLYLLFICRALINIFVFPYILLNRYFCGSHFNSETNTHYTFTIHLG